MINLDEYWQERERYMAELRKRPELRRRQLQALLGYVLRQSLWSFGFFPMVLAVWLPLVFERFNPVATLQNVLPVLQEFVGSHPEQQAIMLEVALITWVSVGATFLIFSLVVTPYRSPLEQASDLHMRAWLMNRSGADWNEDALMAHSMASQTY